MWTGWREKKNIGRGDLLCNGNVTHFRNSYVFEKKKKQEEKLPFTSLPRDMSK